MAISGFRLAAVVAPIVFDGTGNDGFPFARNRRRHYAFRSTSEAHHERLQSRHLVALADRQQQPEMFQQ